MLNPLIELHDVTRSYRIGGELIYALNQVELQIAQGEYIAITGPSGSGKSTLVNVIGGLDTPDGGSVTVNNQNLSAMPDDALSDYRSQTVGFIFQSFNLQSQTTVLENVMLPLLIAGVAYDESHGRALEMLNLVGLGRRLDHKPSQLSGGQQQLTAIARALVMQPKILIADEPTGNLDSTHGQEILAMLQKINDSGTTLLVVTHDPNMAHLADRLLHMTDGKLEELKV
jgi:putative ABC transport system ATP-binding protein